MRASSEPQDGQTQLDYVMLRRVGEACYGAGRELVHGWQRVWLSRVADKLNVSTRVVERWASGNWEIPETIWPELAEVCRERGAALNSLADELTAPKAQEG